MSDFKNFNTTYFEFLEFIRIKSNENKEFIKFYNKNKILKKTNIKYIIKFWYRHITIPYYNNIINNDFDYFLNKDYSDEINLVENEYKNNLIDSINFLKNNNVSEDDKEKFYNFVKKITIYSNNYFKKQ